MYIGSDEDILGLPDEEKKISAEVEHSFDFNPEEYQKAQNFTLTEVKKKKEMVIVEKTKNKNVRKRSKSSNLF